MIALDFDLACTSRLKIYDTERGQRQIEAMGIGAITNALSGVSQPALQQRFKEGTF